MRIAYLIDRESIGGGMVYIRRQIAMHPHDTTRVFTAERGDCTAAKMNAWNSDIIHANHLKALIQLFRNPFVRPHGKAVFTIHGIHLRKYDFLPKTPLNRVKRSLRRMLESRLYRKCDRLIALTESDAQDARRLYGEGLPIIVEPNTLDPADIAPPSNLRYSADAFEFVCIARFNFQKGQDILLAAIARAQAALRKSMRRTLLIGGGKELERMKHAADIYGIADLVEFAGEVPEAGAHMTCGRTLVAPSRWEGMPYLLLEAVARQRQIIASDCTGNRDVLAGYAKARLFPTGDIERLAAMLKEASA